MLNNQWAAGVQAMHHRHCYAQCVCVGQVRVAVAMMTSLLRDPTHASAHTRRAHTKVINDPIHGHFELAPHVLQVIDTPHVQRLRDLKQLGSTYFVYPGASHNRFEHSLGVSHLSAAFVSHLHSNPRDPHAALLFDGAHHFQQCRRLLELAGLAHDLGHGPFSHTFDSSFLTTIARTTHFQPSSLVHHEARSVALFEHCVDQFNIDLDRESVRAIAALIQGQKHSYSSSLIPKFLFDVVANSDTGIDTDKFDYLARDVYNLGLQTVHGFDHHRLMKFAKVMSDSVCFHRKEIFNVYHLFLTRFQLHRTVYNHRAAIAVDGMITDAFLEADHSFHISESIRDPEEFLFMTDSLLNIIERSKGPNLAKARAIVRRIRTRKLYRLVEEVLLPPGSTRKITAEDIVGAQTSGSNVGVEDMYVANVTLNFGMRRRNPVDLVKFFKVWDDTVPVHIPSASVSYVIPVHFEERVVRVYMKAEHDEDGSERQRISQAFRQYMKTQDLGSALRSPVPRQRANVPGDIPTENEKLLARTPIRLPKRPRSESEED